MFRNLIRNFQQLHIIQSYLINATISSKCHSIKFDRWHCLRTFAQNVSPLPAQKLRDENDSEYIVPYHIEKESRPTVNDIVNVLRTKFRLSARDINRILEDENVNRAHREGNLGNTLEVLSLEGVSKKSFINYPWILTIEIVRLKQKIALLKSMHMREINDYVPLLRLSLPRLTKLVYQLNMEADTIPNGNRIYYISEKLGVDAGLVTKYLSKRLFILEMPFDMFEQNLKLMIDYHVSPINILRDLWAFRYTPKAVEVRLERAKCAKKDKIMPWMVRCTEPILQRSLKLSLDELTVLNGKPSTVEYFAERLGYSAEDAKAIMDKHPLTHRVRVTKMKEVLDYLLNEAGFENHEIAHVPRILCHGLRTTKTRIDELKSLGCRPSTLIVVCLSKKEYKKFLIEWTNKKKNLRKAQTADT